MVVSDPYIAILSILTIPWTLYTPVKVVKVVFKLNENIFKINAPCIPMIMATKG